MSKKISQESRNAGTICLFSFRPRPLDVWTFKLPGKRRETKTVAHIWMSSRLQWRQETLDYKTWRYPVVRWVRANKGRYSGLRVKHLLKYGERIGRLDKMNRYRHSGADVKRELEWQRELREVRCDKQNQTLRSDRAA